METCSTRMTETDMNLIMAAKVKIIGKYWKDKYKWKKDKLIKKNKKIKFKNKLINQQKIKNMEMVSLRNK